MKTSLCRLTKCVTLLLSITIALVACTSFGPKYTSGFAKPETAHSWRYEYAGDLWSTLGRQFDLPGETDNIPAVAYEINWYMHHKPYIRKMAEQSKPYLYFIYQQVKKRNLPPEVALMPMVESNFNPFAINNTSGAAGIWQMMPGTASGFGLRVNWWYDGRRDVTASTNAALDYLVYLGKFFDNNWLLAMAAYDTGEGNVQNAIRRNAKAGKSTDFWSLDLPRETRNYVPKILALATILKHPDRYPLDLPPVKNAPYLAKVNVGSQIDLARAAKMAGLSLSELSILNPGFNRWATDPNGPHQLIVPVNKVTQFKVALKKLPKRDRVTWHRITIKHGDTLASISKKYHTNIELIKQINQVDSSLIRPGQTLLIPTQSSRMTKLVIKNERHFFKGLHNIPEPKLINRTVRPGESIAGLAKQYNLTERDIRFWNGLKSNKIKPGMKLIIWPPQKRLYYTTWPYRVKAGDNLIKIAHRYHVSPLLIKEMSHLKSDVLHAGQLLRIPVAHYEIRAHHYYKPKKHKPAPSKHTAKRTQTHKPIHHKKITKHQKPASHAHHTTTKKSYQIYHVKPGDNLIKIGHLFGIKAHIIKTYNHLKTDKLKLKQALKIPA
jgi:membrane-bound lytic murein transglycosylase D